MVETVYMVGAKLISVVQKSVGRLADWGCQIPLECSNEVPTTSLHYHIDSK